MVSKARKLIIALLVADACIATLLVFGNDNLDALFGWVALNIIVAVPAILIKVGLSRRKRAARDHRRRNQKGQRGSLQSGSKDGTYGEIWTTLNGEVVKSKGEKRIADYFYQNNIRYEYEKPAWTKDRESAEQISRPDFYLADFKVYVEYWGMVNASDSETRKNYRKSMEWKINQYGKNGIKFISLYHENLDNLDRVFPQRLKQTTGIDFGNN